MTILYILFGVVILLLLLAIYFAWKASRPKEDQAMTALRYQISSIGENISRIEKSVKDEIATNRTELSQAAKDTRDELAQSLKIFSEQIDSFRKAIEETLLAFTQTIDKNSKDSRKELQDALKIFKDDLNNSLKDFSDRQRENFNDLNKNQNTQNVASSTKLDQIRDTLEKKIADLQQGNEKKLDEMRKTVDEKLQDTLEKRLGESFKLVSDRLEAVHKGLGEMQSLATGVGDLKKVLSNVKTRGVLGEYQLENLLEQILTPEQYGKNVKTKDGSNANVEYAIKLPGREEKIVWLPIDSKFPREDFELLIDSYDKGSPELIEENRKAFSKGIRKCAQDIKDKYIDPPNTTDFAILFLPFESLYAEVLRTPGLFESLQRELKIAITGPTTLAAYLSSLQMGFRTLAIEKRSSEVWELLGAVKTEFGNFGAILDKTQKKLQETSNVIDLAGKRSRAIERKLRTVQELPQEKASLILGEVSELIDEPEEPID